METVNTKTVTALISEEPKQLKFWVLWFSNICYFKSVFVISLGVYSVF